MTRSAGIFGKAKIRGAALAAAFPLALGTTVGAAPATAQEAVSRAVVQPLPPPAARDLNSALQRLARNSQDVSALIDAGTASLALNDVDAAIGFLGRANELRAGDPRVKAGLAAAYLRVDRAFEALQLFAEAERAGPIPVALAADRGLAYDLVGDNAAAQAQYRGALARGGGDEVVRRLALSQAIAGDKRGFETTLFPLLERRDLAAYRARAFGLAILGDPTEAVEIVEAIMPREMSQRVAPYLSYMPRLTRAQQAAAANLGNFPRAAQIGRDDPRLAQYAGGPSPVRTADARLAPAGEPLGPRQRPEDSRSQRRRPDRGSSTVERVRPSRDARPAQVAQAQPAAIPPVVVRRESPSAPVPVASPPPPPAPSIELPPVESQLAATPAPAPSFDLARVDSSVASGPQPAIAVPVAVSPTPAEAAPQTETVTLADAFADFALAPSPSAPATAGAVDITAIKVKREVELPPEPPPETTRPAKPVHPSRRWVQVATGKNLNALAFDWRRFAKKAPALLGKRDAFTTPWGESRRLLTGPFESDRAAQKMVADLKAAGLDTFAFTSDPGQDIAPLD